MRNTVLLLALIAPACAGRQRCRPAPCPVASAGPAPRAAVAPVPTVKSEEDLTVKQEEVPHALDLMTIPLTTTRDEWKRLLGHLDGKLVSVVGCPGSMLSTRRFVVWPRDHCIVSAVTPPRAGSVTLARVLSVRMVERAPAVAEETLLVRVVGRLKIGDVGDSRVLEAWGEVVEARVEVVSDRATLWTLVE